MSKMASMPKPALVQGAEILAAVLRQRLRQIIGAYRKRSDAAIVIALRGRLGELVRAYHNRSDAAVLASFDERSLADIGLTHSDVRDAFASPPWQDPTSLLRARALERRLSRHGISFGLQEAAAAPPLVPELARAPTRRPFRSAA
jgi:uncharacterized protein YjiS (DUF1127 family)